MDIDREIKCVVWDLDNTLWPGVAAEGEPGDLPAPDGAMLAIMEELERRGILNSLASRNDPSLLRDVLARPELASKLVSPQISWEPKSQALAHIAATLNIGLDALAFVDDSPFERAEVEHLAPQVLVLAPKQISDALESLPFKPSHLTAEALQRAEMYRAEELRRQAESGLGKSRADFLKWCEMQLMIGQAAEGDLPRIAEMTRRTHQLNSTGQRYSEEEIQRLLQDPGRLVAIARLVDRFGDYGIIGAALLNRSPVDAEGTWLIDLLMLSCRVEGRGIPAAMLRWIMGEAVSNGISNLRVIYALNERNLPIRLLFRQMGFSVVSQDETTGQVTAGRSLEGDLPPYAEWLTVTSGQARVGG